MPEPTRTPDLDELHAVLAERVRKLEVMPHSRPITSKWRPAYEDLYAIAGHVYMLGCFDLPYDPEPDAAGYAYTSQAAQYLWAALDQQGFRSSAEGEDWTLFLKRLGALPTWDRYSPSALNMEEGPLLGPLLEECRPARPYGPWARTGWASGAGAPPGQTRFQYRALYWDGLPPGSSWEWQGAPDISSYELWDSDTRFDEGTFMSSDAPLVFQDNYWQQSADPLVLVPCEQISGYYSGRLHSGIPIPYEAGPLECPGKPAHIVPDPVGSVIRVRLVLSANDLSLIVPPRVMSPGLASSEYWHPTLLGGGTPHSHGPGLAWLAEGAEAILPEHPLVSSFYQSYLPIAYNSKLRAQHYNWQQLQVNVHVRGRVAARREPDRVILKGRVQCFAAQLDGALFQYPPDWPAPASTAGQGWYLAASDQGPVPINYQDRQFLIDSPWRGTHTGPIQISFDGMVIPLELS